MKELPHTRSCFVCGESNPLGLKLRFEEDSGTVKTHFTPRTEHGGFIAVTHGGLLATVLDEIMVWACAVRTKRFAYCAELGVRYLSPAQPGVELTGTARLEEDRRGRVFRASAQLVDPAGTVVATATGKYLPLKKEAARVMAEDFVGDVQGLFD
jgi:acyl-coenzyme A thioesterase PaaI-like protein